MKLYKRLVFSLCVYKDVVSHNICNPESTDDKDWILLATSNELAEREYMSSFTQFYNLMKLFKFSKI